MRLQQVSSTSFKGLIVLVYLALSSLLFLQGGRWLESWLQRDTLHSLEKFCFVLFTLLSGGLLLGLLQQRWRSLQKKHDRLLSILEGTADAIFLKDLQGYYWVVNPAATKLLDLSESDMIGKQDVDLWSSEIAAKFVETDRTVLQTQQPLLIEETLVINGDRRIFLTRKNIWRDRNGQVAGVVVTAQDITQRKQEQQALKESEERLRLVLQNMPVMLDVFDANGIIKVWNQECERVTGYTAEEVVDNPNAMQLLYADPAYLDSMVEQWSRGGNDYRNWEWNISCKDGSVKTIAWSNISDRFPVPGWMAWGLGVDVTDRAQAEMALRESEERWQLALRGNNDGIWDWNLKTDEMFFSLRWKEMLGHTDSEVSNHYDEWYNRLHPDDVDRVMQLTQDHLDQKTPFYISEHRMRCKDGSYKWILDRGQALWDETGVIARMVGSHTDITSRKQAEDALQQANQELENRVAERTAALAESNHQLRLSHDRISLTNAELARATRLKDEFLANMSHELRTPLNAILGLSEALQEEVFGGLSDRQHKSLHTIEQSGKHLLELIDDILDLSKIEAGMIDLQLETTLIAQVCQSSLGFVRQQACQKEICLEHEVSSDVSKITIEIDERRIRQALINLLSNAVKFTPEGGHVRLEVFPDAVNQTLQLSVIDTGIGISPEQAPNLFQPFVQLDSSLNRRYAGTGLGLALVRRIMELHGGSVMLESKVGQGSRFTLTLPWNPQAQRHGKLSKVLEVTELCARYEETMFERDRPLILLAEDNEANILMTVEYLKAHGYELLLARNGLEAVEQAKTHNPNLIVMDIQMPEMDGMEATRQIRKIPTLAQVPIIALTALAMSGDRARCLAAGANEYVTKPVNPKRLIAVINHYLYSDQSNKAF